MSFYAQITGVTQNDYAQEFEHPIVDWSFNVPLHNHIVSTYGKKVRTIKYRGHDLLDSYEKIPLTLDNLYDIRVAALNIRRLSCEVGEFGAIHKEDNDTLRVEDIAKLSKVIEYLEDKGDPDCSWQATYHRAAYYEASF